MSNLAMIPARMGSQRLEKKNLRVLDGVPLITRAIRRCKEADVFDAIWVNSEDEAFGKIAQEEGVQFHKRPPELADNETTSEGFVYEFLTNHSCDRLFQVHTIAPLLGPTRIEEFVHVMEAGDYDTLLSCVEEQIECALGGRPINFSFERKTNSQDLEPVQRITWSITGWRAKTYLEARDAAEAATYAGKVGFFPLTRAEGHIIKTEEDLRVAEALLHGMGGRVV